MAKMVGAGFKVGANVEAQMRADAAVIMHAAAGAAVAKAWRCCGAQTPKHCPCE